MDTIDTLHIPMQRTHHYTIMANRQCLKPYTQTRTLNPIYEIIDQM